MLYQSGRGNLALTVFVPYDCKNNCPFCTSKQMYNKGNLAEMDYIINNIIKLGNLNLIKDIVFTGGEPFADLKKLQLLIDAAYLTKKNIFINTTMPDVNFINKNKNKITGISVSRHIKVKTQEEFDKKLSNIEVPVRINSVLYNISKDDKDELKEFINKYSAFPIHFRENYRGMTIEKLKNVADNYFCKILAEELKLHYYYGGGCHVCEDEVFENNIHYHRGMEFSSFVIGDTTVINDVIIYPTGEICYDWDLSKQINEKIIEDLDWRE